MLNKVLGHVRLTLKALMLDSMRQGRRSRGRRNAAQARTNLASIFGGFSTAVGNQRRFLRQRAAACESLEFRVLLTTWNIRSDAIYPGSVDQFTTIYPADDNGTGADIQIFWGGDFDGFSDSYYYFDANGGTGGFSQDLGTNPFIKFIGSTGDDIVRNNSGTGVGTAVELTAYGNGGNDEFYGGQGYDKLIGGPGTDKLFGGAGDDVLYGGVASDNDELTGGTGEDRFYVRSTDVNLELGVPTVLDKHKLDSRVHLVDTPNGFSWGTTSYGSNAWSDSAFEAIDKPFGILHDTTQSERLMQTSSGGDIYQFAVGALQSGESIGAWSNGDDTDYYEQNRLEGKTIVHEIAHHFHSPNQNPLNADFRAISGWTETRPVDFLSFANWIEDYPNGGYSGFVQSRQVEANWWFDPKGLASQALFSWEYGGQNPREDFAVTAEAWYQWSIDKVTIHPLITSKQDNLNEFFKYMATPTTPSDLTIDQSININRPTFNWESRVADSFHVQIKDAGNNVIREEWTAELTLPLTADLPAGTYTFLVSSMTITVAESLMASMNFTVNHAPQWTAGVQPPPMAGQNEDDRLAYGTTVLSLTAAASDVDAGAKKGIAIHNTGGVESGSWQYTLNGGLNWADFASLGFARTRSVSFLLPANGTRSRIRFVPNQNFNGTVQLGYYAWDQTQGTAGGNFDISTDNYLGGLTAFSTGSHYSSLTVSPLNDAPVWAAGVQPPPLAAQKEDDRLAYGTTIVSLTAAAGDVDAGAKKGIAIASAPTDKGVWQFTINGGVKWSTLPATTRSNARLLPANGTLSRVRFVPNTDFNGSVQLGYYAWDQTQGTAGGNFDISTANKLGGVTAFSAGIHYTSLTVSPVNDAPVWVNGTPAAALIGINEDNFTSAGTTIVALTSGMTDVDAGAKKGIAVYLTSGLESGSWQFTTDGGVKWSKFASLGFPRGRNNALLLPANSNLSRVRFVPNMDYNGNVQLGYYAWDQTQGTAGGNFDISTANKLGGVTAFSGGSHVSTLTVGPVNDAPEWVNGTPAAALIGINEDNFTSSGTTIASLAAGMTDVDAGAKKGIAVYLTSGLASGFWQFTTDGGAKWSTFASLGFPRGRNNALLLPANGNLSRVRFVPNMDFNGSVQLGYFAWDQTQGTAGSNFDLSTANKLGGVTAFSTGSHVSTLKVSSVNDAPVWATGVQPPPLAVQNEDDRLAYGTTIVSLTAAAGDVDAGAKKGIAIASAPTDKGVWQFTTDGGVKWNTFASPGFPRGRNNALLLPANGTLSRVRFVPNTNFNGTVQLGYYAWDQTQGTAGGNFDISTAGKLGGTTAFSAGIHFSTLNVRPV